MANQKVDKATLIEGLNEDLAYEYQAVIMYNTYAATVTGLHRAELRSFFEAEIADELGHAQLLADKIIALGGTPITKPVAVPTATEPREMLENVAKSEGEGVERYVKRMKQAEAYGDYGLASDLHDIIADETRHKEEAEKILRGKW